MSAPPAGADPDHPDPDNIVRLPALSASADPHGNKEVTLRIRNSLSLLQGYVDMLQGVSPAVQSQVLKVMATKTQALVETLHPFLEQTSRGRQPIDDYRRVRERTRYLISEYRQLLGRLETSIDSISDAGTADGPERERERERER
jgi:hypothetical protein